MAHWCSVGPRQASCCAALTWQAASTASLPGLPRLLAALVPSPRKLSLTPLHPRSQTKFPTPGYPMPPKGCEHEVVEELIRWGGGRGSRRSVATA